MTKSRTGKPYTLADVGATVAVRARRRGGHIPPRFFIDHDLAAGLVPRPHPDRHVTSGARARMRFLVLEIW